MTDQRRQATTLCLALDSVEPDYFVLAMVLQTALVAPGAWAAEGHAGRKRTVVRAVSSQGLQTYYDGVFRWSEFP